jgi:radical SAM superfamily enzyme YgiQ (UPF0313 family)
MEKADYCYLPVGVIALANLLEEKGMSVCGINYGMEKSIRQDFCFEKWLRSKCGPIVLIDLHWFEHAYAAIEIARMCKIANPNTHIILGGLTATFFDQEIMKNFIFIDYIIRGESEKPLISLVEGIIKGRDVRCSNITYRHRETIKRTPVQYVASTSDLNKLDFTDIQFLKTWEKYYKTTMTGYDYTDFLNRFWLCVGRGCPYNCSYCGGSRISHKMLCNRSIPGFRSPRKVADDVLSLADQGVHQIMVSHDLSITGKKYWESVFEEIKQEKVDVGILHGGWQLPSREYINRLVKAFDPSLSAVKLSPESGSEKVRRFNFPEKFYSNQALFKCLRYLRKKELPVVAYFSINLPRQTRESFEQTISMCEKILQSYPNELLSLFCGILVLEPCSPMYLKPRTYGVIPKLMSFMDYYSYCKNTKKDPGYETKDLPCDELPLMTNTWKHRLEEKIDKVELAYFY